MTPPDRKPRFWLDKDGVKWRAHPEVPDEFQILIRESGAWSDADLGPEDGPFMQVCGVSGCRICAEVLYDYSDVLAIEERRKAMGGSLTDTPYGGGV